MKKCVLILSVLLFFLGVAVAPSHAGPVAKFSRGITNLSTGWIEIFITAQQSFEKHKDIGGFIYGIPIGFAKGALRTGAGVYEILTFLVPIPKGYQPIVKPEFITGFKRPVMEDMHDY